MTCLETAERIPAYLDGELPAEEAERFEGHVAACPACAGELAATRRLHAVLAPPLAAPAMRAPADAFEVLWKRVAEEEAGAGAAAVRLARRASARRPARRWAPPAWASRGAAAALAASLALGVWWVGERHEAPRGDSVSVPSAEVAAPARAPAAAPVRVAKKPEPPARAQAPAESRQVAAVRRPEDRPHVARVGHLEEPPDDVRRRAAFYLDYPIVRRLDELENFDEIMAKGRGGDDRKS